MTFEKSLIAALTTLDVSPTHDGVVEVNVAGALLAIAAAINRLAAAGEEANERANRRADQIEQFMAMAAPHGGHA
jgi:hypothetical protein